MRGKKIGERLRRRADVWSAEGSLDRDVGQRCCVDAMLPEERSFAGILGARTPYYFVQGVHL